MELVFIFHSLLKCREQKVDKWKGVWFVAVFFFFSSSERAEAKQKLRKDVGVFPCFMLG
jgi:hypothetical protein